MHIHTLRFLGLCTTIVPRRVSLEKNRLSLPSGFYFYVNVVMDFDALCLVAWFSLMITLIDKISSLNGLRHVAHGIKLYDHNCIYMILLGTSAMSNLVPQSLYSLCRRLLVDNHVELEKLDCVTWF